MQYCKASNMVNPESALAKLHLLLCGPCSSPSIDIYCTYRPHLPSTNHVNAELYGALRIVSKFGRCTTLPIGT